MELRIVKVIALVALWMGMAIGLRAQTVVEYIHTDALGTPVAITNAAGTVIERSVYEPNGQLINRPLTDGPGFTGHVQDAATGLTYMEQRYYDPMIGRFLSIDPITTNSITGANFNRYWYANNNPYRFTDPDGRFGVDCLGSFCDRYRQGGRDCERTCIGGTASVLKRHRTPKSQEKLIKSVGGDTETLKLAQKTHEDFATTLIGFAAGGGLGSAKKQGPVIIGETMVRVEAFAAKFPGAKILNDMPDFKAMGMNPNQVTSAMMQYNRKWILEQMRSGRQIIDIGADANRTMPSIFYQMEQSMLKNYQKLHDAFSGGASP